MAKWAWWKNSLMEDPTSDLGEDIPPDEAAVCEWCGDSLADAPQRVVQTWITDGAVQRVECCDDECIRAWRDSQKRSVEESR